MEVDIDLNIEPLQEEQIGSISGLPPMYRIVKGDVTTSSQELTFRYSTDAPVIVKSDIGKEVEKFLYGLRKFESLIGKVGGTVRLGIYYDLNETITFPLCMSAKCIKLMSKFNLSLDSMGYPCDGDA